MTGRIIDGGGPFLTMGPVAPRCPWLAISLPRSARRWSSSSRRMSGCRGAELSPRDPRMELDGPNRQVR